MPAEDDSQMKINKYLCIHGHFYQPPRENPWLGVIEAQPSARPYHDWNERITRECYSPNGWARLHGPRERIAKIFNNYAYMSFNFGPTLLSWLEKTHPQTYARILAADRASQERYSGHGNALAQVYNHIIMPLANHRDKLTQIHWGLKDFFHRFGRPAEGMWLAEAAVDTPTLTLLAREGVKFTVLSPDQAQAIRPLPVQGGGPSVTPTQAQDHPGLKKFDGLSPRTGSRQAVAAEPAWIDVRGGRIDPRRPYRVILDQTNNLFIDVFFYDGPTSRAVAYERLLTYGPAFLSRIQQAAGAETSWPRLIHLATDGESYGHHSMFGEMALAWIFDQMENNGSFILTNYGYFLERFPPNYQVRIIENSSWSCAHGVERWRGDCGCHVGGLSGWNQKWRAPLREGLNWLRDELAVVFEEHGQKLLTDPWKARDEYINLRLTPTAATNEDFFQHFSRNPLTVTEQHQALALLESQVMALFMFTSCGWFFDDIAGLEPIQDLKYAARAIDLVRPWLKTDLEAGLLTWLAKAKANDPAYQDGAEVYRCQVASSRYSPALAVAHYAVRLMVPETAFKDNPMAGLVKPVRQRRLTGPGLEVMVGECYVAPEAAGGDVPMTFVALRAIGAQLSCLVAEGDGFNFKLVAREIAPAVEEAAPERVQAVFRRHRPTALTYELKDFLPEMRHAIVRNIAENVFFGCQDRVRETYESHEDIINLLLETGEPLPEMANFVMRLVVGGRLIRHLETAMDAPQSTWEAMKALAAQAKGVSLKLDSPKVLQLVHTLWRQLWTVMMNSPVQSTIDRLIDLIQIVRTLNLDMSAEFWTSQNLYEEIREQTAFTDRLPSESLEAFRRLGQELGFQTESGVDP